MNIYLINKVTLDHYDHTEIYEPVGYMLGEGEAQEEAKKRTEAVDLKEFKIGEDKKRWPYFTVTTVEPLPIAEATKEVTLETVRTIVVQLQKIYDETGVLVRPICCCCGDVALSYDRNIHGNEIDSETAWFIKFDFKNEKYTLDEKSFHPS